eukprot:60811-Chlamydomonas_euryale.AAC.12
MQRHKIKAGAQADKRLSWTPTRPRKARVQQRITMRKGQTFDKHPEHGSKPGEAEGGEEEQRAEGGGSGGVWAGGDERAQEAAEQLSTAFIRRGSSRAGRLRHRPGHHPCPQTPRRR